MLDRETRNAVVRHLNERARQAGKRAGDLAIEVISREIYNGANIDETRRQVEIYRATKGQQEGREVPLTEVLVEMLAGTSWAAGVVNTAQAQPTPSPAPRRQEPAESSVPTKDDANDANDADDAEDAGEPAPTDEPDEPVKSGKKPRKKDRKAARASMTREEKIARLAKQEGVEESALVDRLLDEALYARAMRFDPRNAEEARVVRTDKWHLTSPGFDETRYIEHHNHSANEAWLYFEHSVSLAEVRSLALSRWNIEPLGVHQTMRMVDKLDDHREARKKVRGKKSFVPSDAVVEAADREREREQA